MKRIVLFLLLLVSARANAHLSSDFDVNMGGIAYNMNALGLEETLTSLAGIEFNYNLIYSRMNTTFNLTFFEIINSDFGPMPYTRLSLGGKWFPMGLSAVRMVFDSEVRGKKWASAPYIGASLGVSNFSIKIDHANQFNASQFDIMFKTGFDIPMTSKIVLTGALGYAFSLTSSDSQGFSYDGLVVIAGAKLATFE